MNIEITPRHNVKHALIKTDRDALRKFVSAEGLTRAALKLRSTKLTLLELMSGGGVRPHIARAISYRLGAARLARAS